MSKTYDEGYINAEGTEWTCSLSTATETHSDYSQQEGISTFGGPTDLVKPDLTTAQVNSSEFGVTFKVTAGAEGAVVRVDSIKVRVIYRKPLTVTAKDTRRPNALSSVAVLGNRFVITGAGGRVLTSDDNGSTWTERTSGVLEDIWQVRVVANTLYAVGDNGLMITSTDGVTWSRKVTGTNLSLRGISTASNEVIVFGKSGIGIASRDAESWRPV